jgi:AcrR family transcriptional regulator
LFAEQGYDATSMRSIAIASGVDPRLVGYYFGSKQALLEACLVPPPGFVEGVAEVTRTELASRGEALVRSLLRNWHHPQSAVVLRSIILIAAQQPLALERLRLRLEPIVSLPDHEVVACIAPTVQRYLTGELRPGY